MAYTMEYAQQVEPADEVVEDRGVRVLIDPKAVLFLIGTEMDYKTDKLSAQFVFNNPNQTSACGCEESVQLKPSAEAQGSTSALHGGRRSRPRAVRGLPAGRGPPPVRRRRPRRRHHVRPAGRRCDLPQDRRAYASAFVAEGLQPFTYQTEGGTRALASYRRMPDRLYDDPDELAREHEAALLRGVRSHGSSGQGRDGLRWARRRNGLRRRSAGETLGGSAGSRG